MLIPNLDLNFWNSHLKIHSWANLGPKIQSCPYYLKIGAHSVSRMLIPNPDLDFWNFDPKIHFWANLGQKTQSCQFCLKNGTHGISRMLILIPTLVFWISNTNFFSGQIGAKKVKVVCVNWKKAQMISWGCWFLFQHYFYECPSLNSFLGKSEPKKKLSVFPENWHAWHLHDANFYSNISSLNVRP